MARNPRFPPLTQGTLTRLYHTPLFVGLCCEDFSSFDAGLQRLRTREGFRQRMGYGMQRGHLLSSL